MKVIPRLDVSCLYKQTGQALAILPVQNSDVKGRTAQSRKFDTDDDDDNDDKKDGLHFKTRCLTALVNNKIVRLSWQTDF